MICLCLTLARYWASSSNKTCSFLAPFFLHNRCSVQNMKAVLILIAGVGYAKNRECLLSVHVEGRMLKVLLGFINCL